MHYLTHHRRNYVNVCTALLLSSITGQALAGAWTQQEGAIYNRTSINYFYSDTNFDGDGNKVAFADNGEFADTNLTNYLEYGISDKLTAFTSVALKSIRSENDLRKDETWGVGDIDIGLRQQLFSASDSVFSVQGLIKVPEAYDEDELLPLGNGQYDAEIRFAYGLSLWKYFPGYTNIELGYRWRDKDPSDEVRYLFEIGSSLTDKTYTRLKFDGTLSRENGSTTDNSGNPTTTNNFDLLKLDWTVGYKVTQAWSVEAAWTPSITGENTADGDTYTLAISYSTPR
uniref:Transporter n=1 Tax=Marinobacter nauticus TaxID=2743 RepID=A0A455W866_MARNT|nr:hypothetical protein YBY_02410 [Marinobacter nauticus]